MPFVDLPPPIEKKLEDADYDKQQRQARAEFLRRRKRGNAQADADASLKAVSAGSVSDLRRRSRGGARRQSAPGRLVESVQKRSRNCKNRGRGCGWVSDAVGGPCGRCPAGVVHSPGERLCTACHREPDGEGFTHLGENRVVSAIEVVSEVRKPGNAPSAGALESYLPTAGDCLCLREDCREFEREFIEKSAVRDRAREVSVKRAPDVEAAIEALRGCPLFNGDDDPATLKALDGRITTPTRAEEILSAPQQALSKMKSFVAYKVGGKRADKVKPTKTRLFSIAPKNTTNKATNRKGRTSATKDNLANAVAGGREFKAMMLNVGDELIAGGGQLSVERYVDMVAEIGATIPYSMANVEGGERCMSVDNGLQAEGRQIS